MRSDVTNFKDLFEGQKQYSVPLFQRNYTWDAKNWQQLWDDLVALTEEGEEGKQHFLGPLITLPYSPDPAGVSKYMLIDGQQRITTLCVLLNAIRSYVRLSDADLAEELLEDYLINKRKPGTDRYKLLSGTYDREAYLQVLNLELPKERTSGIARAFMWFNNALRKANPNPEQVKQLKNALIGRMTLISIVLDAHENPYEVFESINSKGMALTEAELIKNYLLMRIRPNDHEEVFQKYWNPMEAHLGENLTEYIRHFETRRGRVVKVKEIYATVRQKAQHADALDYLKELHGLHEYYRRFLEPDLESDRFAQVHLRAINQMGITVVYPYLLNLYEYHAEGHLSHKELIESLQIIENLLVRRLLIGDGNQGLNKEMPNLHHVVLGKKISLRSYPDTLRDLIWSGKSYRYVTDERLQSKMQSDPVFGGGSKAVLSRIVLNRIEDYLAGQEAGTANYKVIRILPETLDGDWFNDLTANERERYRDYTDLIGNLTLIHEPGPNEKQNYVHKRNLLIGSQINMNAEFHEIETWNLEVIQQRNTCMAEWIMAIWPQLGTGSSKTNYAEDDPTGKKPVSFTLLGQEYRLQEQTWKELFVRTLEKAHEIRPQELVAALSDARITHSRTESRFISPRAVEGTGLYIETNHSAVNILSRIYALLEALDLDPESDFSCHMVAR